MHPIFYYIPIYMILGALGMALGSRKIDAKERNKRWFKYVFYVLITGVVIASIFLNLFFWIAQIIVFVSLFELLKNNLLRNRLYSFLGIAALFLFGLIAFGFLYFSVSFSRDTLLFVYFQVLIFDAFCQIAGQLFGKHKLASKVSSGKTVEGLIGGIIFCIISAIIAGPWIGKNLYQSVIFGLFTALTSFIGDILASVYKRYLGIKDYSNFLPGQGGFLDRFDSLLMTGAFYYYLLKTIFL